MEINGSLPTNVALVHELIRISSENNWRSQIKSINHFIFQKIDKGSYVGGLPEIKPQLIKLVIRSINPNVG